MDEKIEVLRNSLEYFDKINDNVEKELDIIRAGGELVSVADLLEGVLVLIEMFEATTECHSIDAKQGEVRALMGELMTAIENQDKGLVADIIEYEFVPIISGWQEEVTQILANHA